VTAPQSKKVHSVQDTSDAHHVFDVGVAGGADACYLLEVWDGAEADVGGAVVEAAAGEDLADAGEGFELFEGRGVEVDESVGRGGAGGRGRGPGGGGRGAHHDLLAVDEFPGEVERVRPCVRFHASGRFHGVHHAGAVG